jgi:two-component system, LytTR family, response regulator LytT
MSRVKLLIVEDEMIIASDMKLMLESVGYEVCGIARSVEKALILLSAERPNIVLIDINLGKGMEGIELGRAVHEKFHLPFIFCTSYSDSRTVAEAKQVRPNGYLLKPFTKDDLYVAIEIALLNYANLSDPSADIILQDSIFVKEGKMFTKVSFDEILYVEQDRNYVEIHTLHRVHPVRSSLKDFIKNLPPKKFLQVHRSFIVNISSITAINSDMIKVKEKEIPVSKTFKDELLSMIRLLS